MNGNRLRRDTLDSDGGQNLLNVCEVWNWAGGGNAGGSPRGRSRRMSPGQGRGGRDGSG